MYQTTVMPRPFPNENAAGPDDRPRITQVIDGLRLARERLREALESATNTTDRMTGAVPQAACGSLSPKSDGIPSLLDTLDADVRDLLDLASDAMRLAERLKRIA